MVKKKLTILGTFKSVDMFAQGVKFNLDGESRLKTCMGAILSIFVIFTTLVYAYTRLTILLEFSDTTYTTIEETRVDKL